MRKTFNPICVLLLLVTLVAGSLRAEVVVENNQVKRGKFKLKDGSVISGEVVGPRQDGVSFRYDEGDKKGSYSPKYKWEQFSQETLKDFRQDNRVKQFVGVLIELDPEELKAAHDEAIPARPPSPPLDLKPVPNMGREFTGAGTFGALFSGSGLLVLLALYVANLFASFEVAYFRNYHFAIVCGAGAILPFLGPIVFLCLPTRPNPDAQGEELAPGDTSADSGGAAASAAAEHHGHHHAEASPGDEGTADYSAAPAAYVEAASAASVSIPATQVFKRGDVVINRRFIETKFAPFFRVILGDKEKDLRVVVKSSKGEFIGNRISKVTQADMTLQITDENGTSTEETFPIADLFELQIRHKDAPAQ